MISITETAAKRVVRYIERRGQGLGIKLGVKTRGCSGLAYTIEYIDQLVPRDIVFEEFGVKIYIDPAHLVFLTGTTIDFTREGLNEGFKFVNPNAKSECGCGESFRT